MQQNQQQSQLPPLDFDKLKHFFLNSTDEVTICATLQALRWRVTRVSVATKRQTLHTFSFYDILDCSQPPEGIAQPEKRVLDFLYFNESNRVREFMMSFLNALSSEFLGRSYLLQRTDIV